MSQSFKGNRWLLVFERLLLPFAIAQKMAVQFAYYDLDRTEIHELDAPKHGLFVRHS